MKDKVAFAVGLLGVVIALAPFKDQLSLIYLNYGFASVSVLTLAYISLGILFLSTYLYALEFVKDGFGFLDGLPVFRYLELSGNILYFIAVLSPLMYLILWGIIQLYLLIPWPVIDIEKYTTYISVVISLLGAILSVSAAIRNNKEQMIAKEESLDESSINAAGEARKLVEQRMWSLAIVEAFRSLEFSLDKKIVELGIDSRKMPTSKAAEILVNNKVLSKDDFQKIQYIRDLRNKAVHSSIEYSEHEALEVVDLVKQLLPKLETKASRAQSLEYKILLAMVGQRGLFPKNKFFLPVGFDDYDAKGEGPNNSYLIEVKFTTNLNIINLAISRIKQFAKPGNRIIIVVPHNTPKVLLDDEDVKILYYDPENNEFTNKDEIYQWVYGTSKA